MGDIIKTEISISPQLLENKIGTLLDDRTMLEIHNKFAQMCNEYVPFLEGDLSQTLEITPQYVRYNTPYAHYQYVLHDMAADLAGDTNRTRVYHPKATSYWDKAMMLEKGDLFIKQVENILKEREKNG